jgi:hypothetical protein
MLAWLAFLAAREQERGESTGIDRTPRPDDGGHVSVRHALKLSAILATSNVASPAAAGPAVTHRTTGPQRGRGSMKARRWVVAAVSTVAAAASIVSPTEASAAPATTAGTSCPPGWRQAVISNALSSAGVPRPGITMRIFTEEVHAVMKVTRDDPQFVGIQNLHAVVRLGGPSGPLWDTTATLAPGDSWCSTPQQSGRGIYTSMTFSWGGVPYGVCKSYPSSEPAHYCEP